MAVSRRSRRYVFLAFVSSCLLLFHLKLNARKEDMIGSQWTERRTRKMGVRILSRPMDFPLIGPDDCIRYMLYCTINRTPAVQHGEDKC